MTLFRYVVDKSSAASALVKYTVDKSSESASALVKYTVDKSSESASALVKYTVDKSSESASALIRYAVDQVKYVVEQVNLTGGLSKDDGENIRTIIEEGRKQKVDEMEIEMSRDVAMGLNVNGIEGADVTFGSKGETKYVMKIKYKYNN
jgi:hypothetical protein